MSNQPQSPTPEARPAMICVHCERQIKPPSDESPSWWTDDDKYLPGLCQHNPTGRHHEPRAQSTPPEQPYEPFNTSGTMLPPSPEMIDAVIDEADFAAQPEAVRMPIERICVCGHEECGHTEYGCAFEVARDCTCDCAKFRLSENSQAVILAHKIMDRNFIDPDDDLAVLARQLIRAEESKHAERAAHERTKEEGEVDKIMRSVYHRMFHRAVEEYKKAEAELEAMKEKYEKC